MNRKEGKSMGIAKKIGGMLLALCLVVPCFSMVVNAADGRISFSDPETKVGDIVEVKCAVRSTSDPLGDIKLQLSYDSESLSFESGDSAESDEEGSVVCTGNGGSTEQVFMLKFQALKEGSTQITVAGATITSGEGNELSLDQGNSTIKIAEGDPSKIKEKDESEAESVSTAEDTQVEVDGVPYILTDKFPEGDIPEGYERTTVSLDGQERQMVTNANNSVTLGYLMNGDTGSFYLYNEENATFSPYEELVISDKISIILLSDTSAASLPAEYKEAELTLDEKTFPVWQKPGEEQYYVLYAMNSNGENDYYRYDAEENTYQRFVPESEKDEKEKTSGLLGKVESFIEKNIQKIVFFGGLGLIVIIILIFILGVKLFNRNAELDELYEEYGLNDEEPQPVKEKKKERKPGKTGRSRKKKNDDDFDTEDMSFTSDMDFTEDLGLTADMDFTEELSFTSEMGFTSDMDFTEDMSFTEDMDIEEDFQTEQFEYAEDEFATEELELDDGDLLDEVDSDEFVVYGGQSRTEELTIDDLDELLSDRPKKNKKSDPDDTFKVDFIDLD